MTDMLHMNFIDSVSRTDIEELRRKEETYRGSWKRRGGVGAFMMLARKWDRLEGILESEAWKYDVLRAMTAQSKVANELGNEAGADGTVLAEVRDLRRYLILVEAEMISQLQKGPVGPTGVGSGQGLTGETTVYERRVPRMNADDANQRASLFPWERSEMTGNFELRKFYRHAAPKTWRLEPFVENEKIPHDVANCYRAEFALRRNLWVLKLEDCPAELRDGYPRLQLELNAKEAEEHPFSFLYFLDDTDGKYKPHKRFVAAGWGREA